MVETKLVIPTYRLKEVGRTVKEYRNNFDKYGHDVPILVFDDSPLEIHRRDFPSFHSCNASKNAYYIGHNEKSSFKEILVKKVGKIHEQTIETLLRPSYGGNRNFALLYTIGDYIISVDDDIMPHGMLHKQIAELNKNEVLKGCYVDIKDTDNIEKKEYDIVSAYLAVLGKQISQIMDKGFLWGYTLKDSMADLYTNKTDGSLRDNTVTLIDGKININAKIVTAQTFLTGSPDIDTVDFINELLAGQTPSSFTQIPLKYVLQAFRPCVTSENWRLASGVSGYDNTKGLPPFFPTSLRFEDYVFRIWLQSPKFAAAHIDAVQTHYRNPSMRTTLAHDLLNEELANYLKLKLKERVKEIRDTQIIFHDDLEVLRDEAEEIVGRGKDYYQRLINRATEIEKKERDDTATIPGASFFFINSLIDLAQDISYEFDNFLVNIFHSKMQETVSKEVKTIIDTMEIWPILLDASYELRTKEKLPMRFLNNINA